MTNNGENTELPSEKHGLLLCMLMVRTSYVSQPDIVSIPAAIIPELAENLRRGRRGLQWRPHFFLLRKSSIFRWNQTTAASSLPMPASVFTSAKSPGTDTCTSPADLVAIPGVYLPAMPRLQLPR